jgi:Na+-driven multidrug efflux pump
VTLGWGLQGVWYAIVASAVLKGLGVAALYVSGRWEQAMHRGRELLDAA